MSGDHAEAMQKFALLVRNILGRALGGAAELALGPTDKEQRKQEHDVQGQNSAVALFQAQKYSQKEVDLHLVRISGRNQCCTRKRRQPTDQAAGFFGLLEPVLSPPAFAGQLDLG